jgi:hypothetical protein
MGKRGIPVTVERSLYLDETKRFIMKCIAQSSAAWTRMDEEKAKELLNVIATRLPHNILLRLNFARNDYFAEGGMEAIRH